MLHLQQKILRKLKKKSYNSLVEKPCIGRQRTLNDEHHQHGSQKKKKEVDITHQKFIK